jgi:Na+-translocating ferredoxin:NAD+ oxidoreductase RnfC subunit
VGIKCCHKCVAPKRHPGCHATCPEYIEENQTHQAEREEIRKYKEVNNSVYRQKSDGVFRAYRSRGRKNKF